MGEQGRVKARERASEEVRVPGIVIANGEELPRRLREPRITAFIWGGKVRPSPTLPFGRWKGAA